MIKTIIIEDEINARQALTKMLAIIEPSIEIIGESGTVKEAYELINSRKPDLIFLDIKLENGNGFDVLEQLEDHNAKIIFTTAFNQYATKAFKYSTIDYLLKPIDPNELEEAIRRAMKSIAGDNEHQELLAILKSNLKQKNQKIVLNTTEQRYVILTKNIIRLEADGAYTVFVTQDQKIIVSKNIKYYQELLDQTIFIRCHQSHLVNKNQITSIDKNDKIKMSNSDIIPISTRKKAKIIKHTSN